MKFSEIELPSNRRFGLFFSFVFAAAATYFSSSGSITWAYASIGFSLIFIVVSLVRSAALSPLNKLWMRLGLLLGIVVSPIVLGGIFFGLFTPIALFMRLRGRDELRLRLTARPTHWIIRSEPVKADSFKNQF